MKRGFNKKKSNLLHTSEKEDQMENDLYSEV